MTILILRATEVVDGKNADLFLPPGHYEDLGGVRQFGFRYFHYGHIQHLHFRHALNELLHGLLPPEMHRDHDFRVDLFGDVASFGGSDGEIAAGDGHEE
jgi:hypothetical protein